MAVTGQAQREGPSSSWLYVTMRHPKGTLSRQVTVNKSGTRTRGPSLSLPAPLSSPVKQI